MTINFKKDIPKPGYTTEYPILQNAENGTYDVTLKIAANGIFSIFYDRRRFIRYCENFCGNTEISFTASICDRHFYGFEYENVTTLTVSVMGDAKITSATAVPSNRPVIYIAGDSTVTDQEAEYPYNPHSTYCGWGQMLPVFLKPGIAVSNHAQSGLSTATYLESNHQVPEKHIKPGDYFFIQFGHNDQKVAELNAFGGYYDNLCRLIDFAYSHNAQPVVCTPVNRILFMPDKTLMPLLDEYAKAARTAAEKNGVPIIDLHRRTTEFYTELGDCDSWAYFWDDGKTRDYTHTNDFGGNLAARFVAQGILKENISPLSEFIIPSCQNTPAPIRGYKSSSTRSNPVANIGLINIPQNLDKDISKNL